MYSKCCRSLASWLVLVSMLFTQTGIASAAQVPDSTENQEVLAATADQETMTPEESVAEENTVVETELEYSELMEKVDSVRRNADSVATDSIVELEGAIDDFVAAEIAKLQELGVDQERIDDYVELLEFQRDNMEEDVVEEGDVSDLKMPDNPSSFSFGEDNVEVESLEDVEEFSPWADLSEVLPVEKEEEGLADGLKDLFIIEEAGAVLNQNDFPKLADLAEDGEAVIDQAIIDKARELNNNPVEIYEFVRNHIEYEPYFGAKKGSFGCLKEKVCNDADSASLTVALLRAAGVPARYKKSIIVVPVDVLKEVLGVDENKTAYAALAINDVPVFLVSGNALNGTSLDSADLTGEKEFAVQWIFPEAFYEYDERGANIPNEQNFSDATTDAELKTALQAYPKKQWIPMDVVFKNYQRTKNEILVDAAQMDVEQFWKDYFKYQGSLSPLEKYEADLLASTGKKVEDYLSTNVGVSENVDFIPHSLPYVLGSGTYAGGAINPEVLSSLDDRFRTKVKISLLKESDKSVVLTKTFYGSEVNNVPVTIFYSGETPADQAVIDSYGGIHKTPSNIADIKASIQINDEMTDGVVGVPIGEGLIVELEYLRDGSQIFLHDKFATAGNFEGIHISLSKVLRDPLIDSREKLLMSGFPYISREFLLEVQSKAKKLNESMDHVQITDYSAAIISQRRVLNKINGTPTTFNFKGLNIDAAHLAKDYSRRGNYRNNQENLRLMFGLTASFDEGQIFQDLVGLDGTSTVKGLQYAYSLPNEYTVYEIDSTNKSVIDTLSLSTNTKNNMKADVDDGNTIFTPNKVVTNGDWKGIFYVSLSPNKDGTYSIGEQIAGNGGDTTNDFNKTKILACRTTYTAYNKTILDLLIPTAKAQLSGCDPSDVIELEAWQDIYQQHVYSYVDGLGNQTKYSAPLLCSISESKYNQVIQNKNSQGQAITNPLHKWVPNYGFPCMELQAGGKDYDFVGFDHRVLVASNATKFYSSKGAYQHWITAPLVEGLMNNELNDAKTNQGLSNAYFSNNLKFNIHAGTYSRSAKYSGGQHATFYYSPNSSNPSRIISVYGDILGALDGQYFINKTYIDPVGYTRVSDPNENKVVAYLGFPLSKKTAAAESSNGTKGEYQIFAGGVIYKKFNDGFWADETYYLPGLIQEKVNFGETISNANVCTTVSNKKYCSTAGKYGFPVGNPEDNGYGKLVQQFEGGYSIECSSYNATSGSCIEKNDYLDIGILAPSDNDNEFAAGVIDAFTEHLLYGVAVNFVAGVSIKQIVKAFKGKAIEKFGKKLVVKLGLRSIPGLGWALTGVSVGLAAYENASLISACTTGPPAGIFPEKGKNYYCGKLSVNLLGFFGGLTYKKGINAFNGLAVNGQKAEQGKNALFAGIKSDEDAGYFVDLFRKNPNPRSRFAENISGLDESSLNWVRKDRKLSERLMTKAAGFYDRFEIKKVIDGGIANGYFQRYNNPTPFPAGTAALELNITSAVSKYDFVRFHTANNQARAFVLKRSDIPFKPGGKIDTEKLKQLFAIPSGNVLDEVSYYKPVVGDVLVEGSVNQGADLSVMQYGIKGFDSFSVSEQNARFQIDPDLKNLLSIN